MSWSTQTQAAVTLPSMEANYRAFTNAACEIVWLKKLLEDLSVKVGQFPLFSNNVSCMQIVKNPIFHAHTKHIEVQYHFIKDKVLAKEIDVEHVKTNMHIANIFTKFVDMVKLMRFIS